jgi:hypothetical protein
MPTRVLRSTGNHGGMKTDESALVLLSVEDKKKFEDAIMYLYAGTDAAAVHKPITIYKERNASAYLVAGRYAGANDTHLKYKPLNEEEQKIVVEKLGSGKIVRFLSKVPSTTP